MSHLSSVVIVGAGGHGKVVAEVFRALGHEPIGFVDPHPPASLVLGLPVLGGDELLPSLRQGGIRSAFVALGDNMLRQRINVSLRNMGYVLPTAIHPSAVVSPSARIGDGVLVMPLAIVGTEVLLGDYVIINSAAVIEHDGSIGEAAQVASGCALGGSVRIGMRTLLGVGSVIRPDITIGADVIVGAGSVVVADIADGAVVVGVPAGPIQKRHLT
jgi:sugar O-acyltransferase (sialic acid O-acetyltransferase NeuD family)